MVRASPTSIAMVALAATSALLFVSFSMGTQGHTLASAPRMMSVKPAVLSRSAMPRSSALSGIRAAMQFPGKISCVSASPTASVCNNGLVIVQPSRTLVRAGETSTDTDVDEVLANLKDKLDSIEDKPKAALIAAGGVGALVVANAVVTTIDSLPLVPNLMKLVGTTYSLWFAYRNLLFESSRKELGEDLDALWKKISG